MPHNRKSIRVDSNLLCGILSGFATKYVLAWLKAHGYADISEATQSDIGWTVFGCVAYVWDVLTGDNVEQGPKPPSAAGNDNEPPPGPPAARWK